MEYKRDRKGNIPFSLHDSRIEKTIIKDDSLVFKIDRIFQYVDDEEKWYPCEIEFTKTDFDFCDVLVFNYPYGNEDINDFSGRRLSFEEFIEEYPNGGFEIFIETYAGYDTVFQGEVWNGDYNLRAIMSIWNMGDMIYRIENEE